MAYRSMTLKSCIGCSDGKDSACSAGDPGSISGSERSLGGVNGYPSSILAWRIPWTEEPGGVQSMGSQRVGNDGVTNINTQVCFKKERPYTFIFVQHRASEM